MKSRKLARGAMEKEKDIQKNIVLPQIEGILRSIMALTGLSAEKCKSLAKVYIDLAVLDDQAESEGSSEGQRSTNNKAETTTTNTTASHVPSMVGKTTSLKFYKNLYCSETEKSRITPAVIEGEVQKRSVKLLSLSAGSIKNFPMREYTSDDGPRHFQILQKELDYSGYREKEEDSMLAYLHKNVNENFEKNEKLYFFDEVNATPDATLIVDHVLTSVAEFKNHSMMKTSILAKATITDKKQLAAAMVACGVSKGYLVTKLKNSFKLDTVNMTPELKNTIENHVRHYNAFKNDPTILDKQWQHLLDDRKFYHYGQPVKKLKHK